MRATSPESADAAPPRRVRLLFVLPDLAGGGAQRVTLRLLAGFDPARYAITLLVLDGAGALSPLVPPNLRLIHAPARAGLRLGKPVTLRHAWNQDVLVAATELRASFAVHFAARLLRKPSIAWVHIAFDEYATSLSARNRQRARASYAHFSRVVCVSQGALRSFERWAGESRPGWRAIGNPFDGSAPPVTVDAKARALVLGIGRLEPRKGFDLLIRAAARARAAGADFDLAILGEGPLRAELRDLADREGLPDLQLPGFTPDVVAWLRRASLYVLSSRLEGLPTTILEAFAAGTPVLATRCPHGPEELLQDGACGRLVAVDDVAAMAAGIVELLADQAQARALAGAGRRRLADFSPAVIVPEWERLIGELVLEQPEDS